MLMITTPANTFGEKAAAELSLSYSIIAGEATLFFVQVLYYLISS